MTTAVQSSTANSASLQVLMDSMNGSGNTKKTSTISEGQDRFLRLLTTQLKNQDPLNPMQNAEMTSQLAQISTVDGIEKLNATLQKLLSSSADAEAMQAASLVGHSVMIPGSGMELGDSGAIGGVELGAGADQVTVTITDLNGLTIKTIALGKQDAGTVNFSWDGTNDAGTRAVNGAYRVLVEAKRGQEKVEASALQLANVAGVNRSSQGTTLNLGALGLVTMNDIKQIF